MSAMMVKAKRFLASEEGPTAVEYAFMLAMIIMVCFAAVQSLGTATNTTFNNMAASL